MALYPVIIMEYGISIVNNMKWSVLHVRLYVCSYVCVCVYLLHCISLLPTAMAQRADGGEDS